MIQALLEADHEITAVVRSRLRFPVANFGENERLPIIGADFLEAKTHWHLSREVDAAGLRLAPVGLRGTLKNDL